MSCFITCQCCVVRKMARTSKTKIIADLPITNLKQSNNVVH